MTKEEREARRALWCERVEKYRASGQSVAAWCREHEVKEHQMRYWLRRFSPVFETDSTAATWLPVKVRDEVRSGDPDVIVVRVGDAAIEVRPDFDRRLLIAVVETLAERC